MSKKEGSITLAYLLHNDIVKEYINCYLVENEVRPACLIQFIDYGETSKNDNKSKNILNLLAQHFPTLHHLNTNQGMLISKLQLAESDVDTNTKLGNSLGYLCSDTFDRIKESPQTYFYEYYIILNDKNNTKISLFSFMCPSAQTKDARDKFINIERVLQPMITTGIIKTVKIKILRKPSIDYLISKLYSSSIVTDDDASDILEVLMNFGFTKCSGNMDNGNDVLNFDSPFHKGIIISLLNFIKTEIFNTLLQINETDKQKIYAKINLWDTHIKNYIIESEKKPSAKASALDMPSAMSSAMPSVSAMLTVDNPIHNGINISLLNFINTGIFATLLGVNEASKQSINEKLNLWDSLIKDSIIEYETKPRADVRQSARLSTAASTAASAKEKSKQSKKAQQSASASKRSDPSAKTSAKNSNPKAHSNSTRKKNTKPNIIITNSRSKKH